MRNRGVNKPSAISAEHFNGELGSDAHFQRDNIGRSLVWAPFERQGSYVGILFSGLFMEMLGTLLFSFFTNMVVTNVGQTVAMDPILNGFLVAIVSASTYFMAAGGWRIRKSDGFNELPRHLSWTVTFTDFLMLRTGLLIMLLYWTAQVAGALAAGGLLRAFIVNSATIRLPLPTDVGLAWGGEIFGAGVISLIYIYSKYFGGSYAEEEQTQRLNAVSNMSIARFGLMVVFYPLQIYYFDATLYITAVIATCVGTTCANATPFPNAPAFYLLVPFIGAVIAALVYYFLLAIGYASRGGSDNKGGFPPRNSVTTKAMTRPVSRNAGVQEVNSASMLLPKLN